MKIRIVTPAGRGTRSGNRATAVRWAALLREIGHRVSVGTEYRGDACDHLIAVHASKTHDAIAAYRRRCPAGAVTVLLAGTDLYEEGPQNRRVSQSMEWATRLVVLQPLACRAIPVRFRAKVRVIRQSAKTPAGVNKRKSAFDVCVIGHLRAVKDPFRTAYAVRRLPVSSRIQLRHVGGALTPAMQRRALAESRRNPRYRWLGDLPRAKTLRILAGSRALVVTSRSEGGANVISEAIVCGVPIIASRIDGSVGLLGDDYPAYYPVGGTASLAVLLERVEHDPRFRSELEDRVRRMKPAFRPAAERVAWRTLLAEL